MIDLTYLSRKAVNIFVIRCLLVFWCLSAVKVLQNIFQQ